MRTVASEVTTSATAALHEEGDRALTRAGLVATVFGFLSALALLGVRAGVGVDQFNLPVVFASLCGTCGLLLYLLSKRGLARGVPGAILLGTFTSLPTLFYVVIARVPGVEVASFITGPISYLYCFMIVTSGFRLSPSLSIVLGLLAALEFFVVQMTARPTLLRLRTLDPHLFDELTTPAVYAFKSSMLAAVGVGTGVMALLARRLVARVVREAEEKRLLDQAFGEYVSPEVRQAILAYQRERRSTRRNVAVLFSDLRGFSTLSENRDPEEVVATLNGYFERMVRAISREHGVVDKFIGDAVMATFGGVAPIADPAAAAFRAARAMRAELDALNVERSAAGQPPLDNGIGLHVGEVLIGPIGGAGRSEFTVIGDAVNIAARLESLTKEHGRAILLSDAIYEALSGADRAGLTSLGEVTVKGRQAATRLFGL